MTCLRHRRTTRACPRLHGASSAMMPKCTSPPSRCAAPVSPPQPPTASTLCPQVPRVRWAASCCFTCPSTGDLLPTLSLVSATSRRFACLSRWRTCPHPGLFLSVCAVPPHVTERPRATTSASLPPVCCPCGSDGVNEQACFREAIAPTLVHGAKVFHWGTLHKARIGFLGLTVEHSSWTNFCLESLWVPTHALTGPYIRHQNPAIRLVTDMHGPRSQTVCLGSYAL